MRMLDVLDLVERGWRVGVKRMKMRTTVCGPMGGGVVGRERRKLMMLVLARVEGVVEVEINSM
jgi:hypothetical protein